MSELCVFPGVSVKITNVVPGGATPSAAIRTSLIPIICPLVMIDKKPVLTTTLSWVATGCTFGSTKHTAGSGAIIAANAKKTTLLKLKPLLKGDIGFCAGTFIQQTGPVPVPIPCSCKFEIDDAGQTKVKES